MPVVTKTSRKGYKHPEIDDSAYVIAKVRKGDKMYIAKCPEIGVYTQGKTFEELEQNLREAVDLALDDGDNVAYHLPPSPHIMIVFEELL